MVNSLNSALPAPAPLEAEVIFKVFSMPKENSLTSNQPLNWLSVLSPTIFSALPPLMKLTNASNAMRTLLYNRTSEGNGYQSQNRLRRGGQSPFVPRTPQKGTV